MSLANCEEFWQLLSSQWNNLYPRIFNNDKQVLDEMQNMLGNLSEHIELELTYGQINSLVIDGFSDIVELYISPRMKKDNIPIMNQLYNNRCDINNLIVSKYKSYNFNNRIIKEIDFKSFKVSYDDFGFQGSIGISNGMPLLNLVIVVKKSVADKILVKKTVQFIDKQNKQSSRDVYMSQINAIDIFLMNILGEYHLMNHIGYIELLPSDHELITTDAIFTELKDIKKNLKLITKSYNYSECGYCSHHELQTILKKCGRCKKVKYCSKKCQILAYGNHKSICQS